MTARLVALLALAAPTGRLALDSASHVGKAMYDVLSNNFSLDQGTLWNYTRESTFPSKWILDTPANQIGRRHSELIVASNCSDGDDCDTAFKLYKCSTQADCDRDGRTGTCTLMQATVKKEGDAPGKLCVGHSDSFVDEIYKVMVSTQNYLDIATLGPAKGRFLVALNNALNFLDSTNRSVQVRFLYGAAVYDLVPDVDGTLGDMTTNISTSTTKLKMVVGAYRRGPLTWNHAKIIAVDGNILIEGGHNLWGPDYLAESPVHDVSIALAGPAAIDAHRFLDRLWDDYLCQKTVAADAALMDTLTQGRNSLFLSSQDKCAPKFNVSSTVDHGFGERDATLTFQIGRIGHMAAEDDACDHAIWAMFDAARTSIKMSIQDLGAVKILGQSGGWGDQTMSALSSTSTWSCPLPGRPPVEGTPDTATATRSRRWWASSCSGSRRSGAPSRGLPASQRTSR